MENIYNVPGLEDSRYQDFVAKVSGVSVYQVVKVFRAMALCNIALEEEDSDWSRFMEIMIASARSGESEIDTLTGPASQDQRDATDMAYDLIMTDDDLRREFYNLRDTRNPDKDIFYQLALMKQRQGA